MILEGPNEKVPLKLRLVAASGSWLIVDDSPSDLPILQV
jgi:hypothetical protein